MTRVLILGEGGQVAEHLKLSMPNATAWGRSKIDWTQPAGAVELIAEFQPTHIINAVAYTNVDLAEDEAEVAWQINAEAPMFMAQAANVTNATLLHFSTDYVFDGSSSTPISDDEQPSPINVYGKTKLAGEKVIAQYCDTYWILRASWVFSEFGSNFVKTMLRLFNAKQDVNVVADQFGRPTYAGDLAAITEELINADDLPAGVYHFSGGESSSWFQFAEAIAGYAYEAGVIDHRPQIAPIITEEYPTKASRPMKSVLKSSEAFSRLGAGVGDWRSALPKVMSALHSS